MMSKEINEYDFGIRNPTEQLIELDYRIVYKRNQMHFIGIKNSTYVWYPLERLDKRTFIDGIEKLLSKARLEEEEKDEILKNKVKLYYNLKKLLEKSKKSVKK